MPNLRPGVSRMVALGLGLLVCGEASHVTAQPPSAEGRAKKSVYGKLDSVDTRLKGVVMRTDEGKRLAWRFTDPVIAEIEKVKPGNPMIVIYRQVSPNDRRVTAVAFPGTAETPTYLNLTGERVSLRSAPMVDGACALNPDPVQETTIPRGGMAEVVEGCWCCAAAGDACVPGNKSGVGRALLVGCFE